MHEPLPHRVVVPIGITAEHVLHRDIETRSQADLKKVGPAKYAADKTTEVLCVAYAVDHGPVQLWRPGDPLPAEFLEAAADPSWIVTAHNDAFESAIEQHVLRPLGWPIILPERHRCTMSMSLAVGLPAKLAAVAHALELRNRKDAAGERLMHQMSKPRRARQDEDAAAVHWFEDDDRGDVIGPKVTDSRSRNLPSHPRRGTAAIAIRVGERHGNGASPRALGRPSPHDRLGS